jgi:hypothetical protein
MVTILQSMPGRMEPEDPNQMSLGAVEQTTVHVSVSPWKCLAHFGERWRRGLTVTLANLPRREDLVQILGSLFTQRCRACENGPHGAEVVLGEELLVLRHQDDDGGYLGAVSLKQLRNEGDKRTKNNVLIL